MRSKPTCCVRTKLHLYMSKPIKALSKARDLYVKKLEEYAAKVSCDGPFCCAVPAFPHHSCLPRSSYKGYSKPKNNDWFRVRHIKKASKERRPPTRAGPSPEPEGLQNVGQVTDHVRIMSYGSAGLGYLGRIDEDKPSCFEEDFMHFRTRSLGLSVMTNLGFLDAD